MCKKLAKPGSVFYFLQCPLPLYVGTNYHIQRNWSHYSFYFLLFTLFPIVYCVKKCYPLISRFICSHSLNIRSFYASHFCTKKTPKEKKTKTNKQRKQNQREKSPPKQTNKNVLPLYLYWRLRLCINSMYVTCKVKGYKTLKT